MFTDKYLVSFVSISGLFWSNHLVFEAHWSLLIETRARQAHLRSKAPYQEVLHFRGLNQTYPSHKGLSCCWQGQLGLKFKSSLSTALWFIFNCPLQA